MIVPFKFKNIPILIKLKNAINCFIDLVYMENGTLFSRPFVFIMLCVIILGTFIVAFGIGINIYKFLF